MKIDESTLSKIAHLSRLEVNEKDALNIIADLNAIVAWVDKLNELDTEGVEPLATMSQEINSLREDRVGQHLLREDGLNVAPENDGTYFTVPKVIG